MDRWMNTFFYQISFCHTGWKMNSDERSRDALRATWIGFTINIVLTILKFIAGVAGRSSAMIADAVHSLSDIASDLAVIFGIKAANKPQDDDHDFGHGKYETLVTTFIGLFLFGVAIGLVYSSSKSLWGFANGESIPRPGTIAVAAALLSIFLKEGIYHYTMKVAKRVDSKALEANAWHHRTDSLSSVGVFIGIGGAIILGGDFTILDPLAALIVSMLIFKISFKLVKESVLELTEASLDRKTEERIIRIISSVKGANRPHNLRTRRIGAYIAIDVHVKAPGRMILTDAHDIADRVEKELKKEFGEDTYVYIHMDPEDV